MERAQDERARGTEAPGAPQEPRAGQVRTRRRGALFAAVAALCATVAVGYVAVAVGRADEQAGTALGSAGGPGSLLFQHVGRGPAYARVAVASPGSAARKRTFTSMTCERLHYAGGRGVCLRPAVSLAPSFEVIVFDREFRVLRTFRRNGLITRARVSPDGRLAATTGFVSGHSYADDSFSTETVLAELGTGRTVANLEQFTVRHEGRVLRAVDFNFWGVTFAGDGDRFYATLATRGRTHLVVGSVRDRELRIVRQNVECPSLSPDGTRIAYKKRIGGDTWRWRFHVLDLRTLAETPLAEERPIDDQVEWLDDEHVLYGFNGTIWRVPADGTGAPVAHLRDGLSPAVLRELASG